MNSKIRTATMAVVVALASACSGGGEDSVDEAFEELFGAPNSDGIRLVQLRELTEIEEHVSECMAEVGFTYSPVSYEGRTALSDQRADDPEGFTAEYGYGIVEEATRGFGESPNADYVEALSTSEREEFLAALVGEAGGSGPVGLEYEPRATPDQHSDYVWYLAQSDGGGCFGSAIGEATYMNRSLSLGNLSEATQEDLADHSRYQELVDDWRLCMSDLGFSFDQQFEAQNAVLNRLGPLLASVGGDVSAVEEELADIARFEREVAAADAGCGGPEVKELRSSIERESIVDAARERGEL